MLVYTRVCANNYMYMYMYVCASQAYYMYHNSPDPSFKCVLQYIMCDGSKSLERQTVTMSAHDYTHTCIRTHVCIASIAYSTCWYAHVLALGKSAHAVYIVGVITHIHNSHCVCIRRLQDVLCIGKVLSV